ncbi:hypothetical protein [Knoellia koreensis]|uniref:Uncharacterized protein n=1 Tax=Knoellia koreensis TaxID=2730921 RepID=A0A849H5J7_9MICO|nr:hypothetical protein [Knoellia sp. DB2414S]NNM45060.1 hypothetical protein [Knoellia sp. DB2414S]
MGAMTGAGSRSLPWYAVGWRLVVTFAVVVTVALGTLVGNDGWWPFAPMSQYAFSVKNDGVINSLTMDALTVDGEVVRVPLSKEKIGIERSEIEGQAPRIVNNPGLLQDVAVLHRRRLPDEAAYRTIWLRNTQRDIRTRSETVLTLATWNVVDPLDPQPSGIPQDAR